MESPVPGVVNPDNYSDRYTFYFKPEQDAVLYFSAGGDDGYRLLIDGEELIGQWYSHPFRQKEGFRKFEGGRLYRITYEHFDGGSEQETMFRYADYLNDPVFFEAVRTADAVVVCVGYDWYLESESWDRPFALPEGHLYCLESVLEHTDKAVVVINSGGGVEMAPWLDRTGGVLMAWYQGQQGGDGHPPELVVLVAAVALDLGHDCWEILWIPAVASGEQPDDDPSDYAHQDRIEPAEPRGQTVPYERQADVHGQEHQPHEDPGDRAGEDDGQKEYGSVDDSDPVHAIGLPSENDGT